MDDVLVDTCRSLCDLHGIKSPYDNSVNHGVYEFHSLVGFTHEEMWDLNWMAWATLKPMKWAQYLVALSCDLVGKDNVYMLSAPMVSEGCCYGKQKWIEYYFPNFADRLILTKAKYSCVPNDGLLFDDSQSNEEEFKKRDKQKSFYLFPSLNNRKAREFMKLDSNPSLITDIFNIATGQLDLAFSDYNPIKWNEV